MISIEPNLDTPVIYMTYAPFSYKCSIHASTRAWSRGYNADVTFIHRPDGGPVIIIWIHISDRIFVCFKEGLLRSRVGCILRYLQVFAPRNHYETANNRDQHKRNFLPFMNLQLVQLSHWKNVYKCILKYIVPSVCKEESIDVDARSLNLRVPSFANRSTLEILAVTEAMAVEVTTAMHSQTSRRGPFCTAMRR